MCQFDLQVSGAILRPEFIAPPESRLPHVRFLPQAIKLQKDLGILRYGSFAHANLPNVTGDGIGRAPSRRIGFLPKVMPARTARTHPKPVASITRWNRRSTRC